MSQRTLDPPHLTLETIMYPKNELFFTLSCPRFWGGAYACAVRKPDCWLICVYNFRNEIVAYHSIQGYETRQRATVLFDPCGEGEEELREKSVVRVRLF